MPKFDEYTLGNIGEFIQGFAQKRGQIAEANQADKQYKLETVQTMFDMAQGLRTQAEASQLRADDTSLSPDARARHRAEADRALQEGSRIYAGASELFGMIDEKPKTGKKPNPAMQFLQFINPFVKRGPEPGEFEARLQELMVGLGGKGQTGGGGGEGTTVGAGMGAPTTTGQGAPTTTGVDLSAMRAAVPGGTTGQLLAAERGVVRAAEPEPMIPGTIFPESARGIFAQPDFSPAGAAAAVGPQFPHITGGRFAPQFGHMPTDQYNANVALEVGRALDGLSRIQTSTPELTETFEDMANNPRAWQLYSAASRGTALHPELDSDALDRDLAMIFPDLRPDRPEVGETLLRDFESDLRRTVQLESGTILGERGEVLPMDEWPLRLQKKAARYRIFESVATDAPEVPLAKNFIDAARIKESDRSPQHKQDIIAYTDARMLGLGGGARGTAGAPESFSYGPVRETATGQMVLSRRGRLSGQAEIVRQPNGEPFYTGSADISKWQATTPIMIYPPADAPQGSMPFEVYPLLPWIVIGDLAANRISRAQLRPLMELPMFDQPPGAKASIEQYLRDNPDIGGPEPATVARDPNPYR